MRTWTLLLLIPIASLGAEPKYQRLYPVAATAWTFLHPATSPVQNPLTDYASNYAANYAIDDDPATAWVEGAEGNGEGQKLFVYLTPQARARALRLRIRNGYQKSDAALAANAAPKDVTITLSNARGDDVFSTHATLAKQLGWQQIDLVPPQAVQVGLISLRIDSVHAGSRFKDTCISDVQVLADSEAPPDPAAEKANRATLAAWLQDQRLAAAYIANHAPGYPFAARHFKTFTDLDVREPSDTEGTEADPERRPVSGFPPLETQAATGKYSAAWRRVFGPGETARIRHLLDLAQTKGRALGTSWQRVTFTGRIALPIGLGEPEYVDYLDRSNFQLAEIKGSDAPISEQRSGKIDLAGRSHEWTNSNARALFRSGSDRSLRELYFWRREADGGVRAMAATDTTSDYLVLFDERERAEEVLQLTRTTCSTQGWKSWSVRSTRFFRDASGRIEKSSNKMAVYTDQGGGQNSYAKGISLAASEDD